MSALRQGRGLEKLYGVADAEKNNFHCRRTAVVCVRGSVRAPKIVSSPSVYSHRSGSLKRRAGGSFGVVRLGNGNLQERGNERFHVTPRVTQAGSASWNAFQHQGNSNASQLGDASATDAPSCLFLGPLESATREQLEQFYAQARDAYYSGKPLVSDDIFDLVERRLRWFHSELVKKYPRCSIRALYCYSDAEADPSQMAALSTMWSLILAAGAALTAMPLVFLVMVMGASGVERVENPILSSPLWQLDGAMAAGICFLLGVVLASAAARPLQRIMQGKMVALQGNCPHCGEEVYSFITLEEGARHRHKAECHVCGQPLVFHAFVEASPSNPKHSWAYGRIYVVARAKDLEPPAETHP